MMLCIMVALVCTVFPSILHNLTIKHNIFIIIVSIPVQVSTSHGSRLLKNTLDLFKYGINVTGESLGF